MKKIITMLCLIIFSNSAFAVQNYTYTRVEDESYSASSPTGYFAQYNTPAQYGSNTQYSDNNGFQNVNYVVYEQPPVSIQDIRTPQSYNTRRVVTESMRDDRERADKIIDRTGRVAGTLGFLGLVTMGIIGIAHAL